MVRLGGDAILEVRAPVFMESASDLKMDSHSGGPCVLVTTLISDEDPHCNWTIGRVDDGALPVHAESLVLVWRQPLTSRG